LINLKRLGVAAVLSSASESPVLAQAVVQRDQISLSIDSRRRQVVTRLKILSAAAVLSLTFATPVFAQAAIQEPGAFAFYYPNNDVLNGGRPTPAAGMDAKMPLLFGSNPYVAMHSSADGVSCAERYRSYDRASGTFLGHDGRRHECE
jgi:BA14K-like protein